MNIERDKFLAKELKLSSKIYWDFSSWQVFGMLWTWAQAQEWWEVFIDRSSWDPDYYGDNNCGNLGWCPIEKIHPDRFADDLYEFLTNQISTLHG